MSFVRLRPGRARREGRSISGGVACTSRTSDERRSMMRTWIILGAVNAFLSVAAGAFGAHALKARLPQDPQVIFETGAPYHMSRALGLLAVGLVGALRPSPLLSASGWAMLAGIVLFS